MKKKEIVTEFKKFISRGSVVDLACGVIVGTAFSAITNSLVKDIITPLAGFLLGNADFSQLKLTLIAATETKPALTMNYGNFINAILNFIIISIVAFFILKSFSRLNEKIRKEEKEKQRKAEEEKKAQAALEAEKKRLGEEAEAKRRLEEYEILRDIRDILKESKQN